MILSNRRRAQSSPLTTHVQEAMSEPKPSARRLLGIPTDYNPLVYAMAGHGTVGHEGAPSQTGQLAVLGRGNTITVQGRPNLQNCAPNKDDR